MRPITREIIDRRQPGLRWTAVLAGALVSVALWMLLQMIGMGAGMAAIELDDAGSLRSVGIGTTVWTLVAPLIALGIGGFVAGRLASTYEDRVGAMHGFVTWAIASIVGLLAIVSMIGMLTGGAGRVPTRGMAVDDMRVAPSLRQAEIQEATDDAGKMLLGGALSLLVGLGAAVGGGALAANNLKGPRRKRATTQEVPVVPPPAEPPADAPHVTAS